MLEGATHCRGTASLGERPPVETEATRFRRRRTSTLAPFVMDLTVPELKKLDALALAAGYSRSALVRQLIVEEGELAPSATL